MTIIKKFALAAFVAGSSVAFTQPSHAFMMGSDDAATITADADIVQSVDQVRTQWKAGSTECDVMLAQIDKAISQIDAALDKGVADEAKYLGMRDELVEMRLSLPCLANELAQDAMVIGDEPLMTTDVMGTAETTMTDGVVSDVLIGSTPLDGTSTGGAVGGGQGASFGGGTGGGGAAGAGGIGGFAALAGIGAIIAVSVDDNSNPGINASPSN